MSSPVSQGVFLAIAFFLANLPWLSQRCFLILQCDRKSPWLRLLEWFVLYFMVGLLALGFEKQATDDVYSQGWEFYTVTLALFMVFAFPGFIYRFVR